MSDPTLRQKVTVTNPQGLHIRPATMFAEVAQKFIGDVHVCKDDKRVNGKYPMELFLLLAEQGSELTIEVLGPGADSVLPELVKIINTAFPDA